jgi:glutamyl-Q tRNA(Asp) synthetase
LADYGFEWDGDIIYQSQRQDAYHTALTALHEHTYACTRSRKGLPTLPSIRVRTPEHPIGVIDSIQGNYCQVLSRDVGDFVLLRADGLFAYQLAVVVDDAFQGVNQIVRGADLLDNTPRQCWLQHLLGYPQPSYAHIPLAVSENGQ